MNIPAANISQIIDHLYNVLVEAKVSNHIYYGSMPATLPAKLKDCVLIDVGSSIADYDAYESGILNVYLYVKPNNNGMLNAKRLNEMETVLRDLIDSDKADTENYTFFRLYKQLDYDTVYNMHFAIYALRIKIS